MSRKMIDDDWLEGATTNPAPDRTVEEQKRMDEEQGIYTIKKTWPCDWDMGLINVLAWIRTKLFG